MVDPSKSKVPKTRNANIPLELIINILSRLSVNILCRFKLVSKQWLHLISSDPHFKSLHRQRSETSPLILSSRLFRGGYDYDYDYDKAKVKLSTIDMSGQRGKEFTAHEDVIAPSTWTYHHGLFCCVDLRDSRSWPYVCNPSTREKVRLPDCSPYRNFDIGYIPSLNQYKILHFFLRHPFADDGYHDGTRAVEVFSLTDGGCAGSGSWRDLGDVLRPSFPIKACVNGTMYWLAGQSCVNGTVIVSFHLDEVEFRYVSMPQGVDFNKLPDLVGLKECLCVVDYCACENSTINIWMLKDQRENIWVKEYNICVQVLNSRVSVLGYIPINDTEGEILCQLKHVNFYSTVMRYSTKNKSFCNLSGYELREGYNQPKLYFDSLFSLGSRNNRLI